MLDNESTIKYMENEIARLEQKTIQVEAQKQVPQMKKPYDIQRIKNKLKHMVEHLDETFRNQMDGIKKARLFGLFFNQLPTYAQLTGGTAGIPMLTDVNPVFLPKSESIFYLAGQTRQNLNRLLLALGALERQFETLDILLSNDSQMTCNLCI